MKQQDIALIVVIAFIAAVVAFFVSSKVFVTPANRQQQVKIVNVIDSNFQSASNKYFNKSSIDPYQEVKTGSNNNQHPFNSGQQQ
jgi:hypothetical protein